MSDPSDRSPDGSDPDDARIDAIARAAFAERPEGGDPPDGAPDDEAGAPPAIDLARLLAWRAGDASPEEAARIEAMLAGDPEARSVLRELSEPVPPFLQRWATHESRQTLGRSATRWVAPVAGLALAAAVVAFALLPGRIAPPDYHIEAVRGVHAPVRGDDAAPTRAVVDPESVLVLALAPGDARQSAPAAVAFAEVDGRLRAAPATTLTAGDGGALRFEAPVTALFGQSFGARRLRIALGGEGVTAEALRALDGEPVEAAEGALRGVRWLTVELDYREAPR